MATGARRELLVSKGWVQAAALVILFGFFILGLLAYRTYMAQPPMPVRVVDPDGEVLYTGEDVSRGQQVFLHNGLMEYGSVFGHGAYLGPDFTADYLRRSSDLVTARLRRRESDAAARRTIEDFRTNRYDEDTRHAHAHRARRPTPSAQLVGLLQRASSPTRRPSTACAPTRSPTAPSCAS